MTDSLVVGGTPVSINVTGGAQAAITGTGITIGILGQTISADVTITNGRDAAGNPIADIGLAHLTASFGGTAGSPVLTVTQTAAPAGPRALLGGHRRLDRRGRDPGEYPRPVAVGHLVRPGRQHDLRRRRPASRPVPTSR